MTRRVSVYLLVTTAAILVIAGLIHLGGTRFSTEDLHSTAPATADDAFSQILDNARLPLPRLILQLVVVVLVARALGLAARRAGQPPVIGEIAAGILLGPSLLGWIAPEVSAYLFPAASLPVLHLFSQIGVLLFMFLVGVELEPAYLHAKARAAIAISHFGIVIPFTLGVALSLALYAKYAPPGVAFHAFALFCGIAMSITAFPVLSRILQDRNLTRTSLGATAITSAAVDDVTAWSVLAFVVAVTTAGGAVQTLLATVALAATFVLVMVVVIRPLLKRALDPVRGGGSLGSDQIAIVLVVTLSSALVTEIIGIHALFGAFVAGVIMPVEGTVGSELRTRLESITSVILLPLFFVYTGLRTHIGLLGDAASWATCLVIIVVATAGKLGGTVLAGRWTGLSWRESIALGALLNTRGLMELVALNVGYDLGILTPEIFAMMVVMALVTTAMAGPILSFSLSGSEAPPSSGSGHATRDAAS